MQSKHTEVVNKIKEACNKTRMALRSYRKDEPDKDKDKTLVVSSAFVGAAVQYSHGLSVFFPWTAPLDDNWKKEYSNSQFSVTNWADFLETYFKETMRETRAEEFKRFPDKENNDEQTLSRRLIKLMTEASSDGTASGDSPTFKVFGQLAEKPGPDGTLGKRGPDDPMGKRGPDDPTGLSCDCGSIKNYPRFT